MEDQKQRERDTHLINLCTCAELLMRHEKDAGGRNYRFVGQATALKEIFTLIVKHATQDNLDGFKIVGMYRDRNLKPKVTEAMNKPVSIPSK